MLRILVNGVEQTPDIACQCWGELLERLDQRAAVDGQVVTTIRFDGVDHPSFRDPACGPRPLLGLKVVEAESSGPHELLETSANEAIVAARALSAAAERVGAAFRGFGVATASQDLAELARGIATLIAIAQALSQALGLSLDALSSDNQSASQMVEELTAQADALIGAQENGDWITVADVIEYEIAPALEKWPGLIEVMKSSIRS